jgi:hypothetical protein
MQTMNQTQTSAALSDLHARMALAGCPQRPIDDYSCVSVVGGWQTRNNSTMELFGPVYNSSSDLYAWQRENLPKREPQTADDIERAAIAYWVAHGKALALQCGSRGSFAALIGDAFIRADKRNAARLISDFPD